MVVLDYSSFFQGFTSLVDTNMESLDENTQRILERARLRRMELENENDVSICDAGSGSVSSPARSNVKSSAMAPPADSPSRILGNRNLVPPAESSDVTPEKTQMKSRFAALAADMEAYEVECTPPHSKSKEAYMKGNSPRLSIGEVRPSVLCAPKVSPLKSSLSGNYGNSSPVKEYDQSRSTTTTRIVEEEEVTENGEVISNTRHTETRNVRFSEHIAATPLWDEQTSFGTLNESDLSRFAPSASSTFREDKQHLRMTTAYTQPIEESPQSAHAADEFGLHTFLVKKKQSPGRMSSSSLQKMISPKPFVPGATTNLTHSPVHFSPHSTSSPLVNESRIEVQKQMVSGIPVTAMSDSSSYYSASTRVDFVDDLERSAKRAVNAPSTPVDLMAPSSPFRGQQTPKQDMPSPIRPAIDSARAKTIAQQLEDRVKQSGAKIPSEVTALRPGALASLPTITSSYSTKPLTKADVVSQVTPRLQPIHTQWRGATGTPVVTGADPSEPSKPDAKATNIKSLRNRWEFSSATGTPLHPDADENDLLASAVKMAQSSQPSRRNAGRLPHARSTRPDSPPRRLALDVAASPEKQRIQSATHSPYAKSPRMHQPEQGTEEDDGEVFEEEDLDESRDEILQGDESRVITEAFEFMESSPNKMAPLAQTDEVRTADNTPYRSPMKSSGETPIMTGGKSPMNQPNFENSPVPEEHSPVNDSTASTTTSSSMESRDQFSLSPHFRAPPPPELETADQACSPGGAAGLMHTVSFYRKRRHEKTGAGLEKIVYAGAETSRPTQVIGVQKNLGEDEKPDKEELVARLRQSISVQQEQVAQASRAISFCRQTDEFRGSREEVDAQRALLIATETRRALIQELERVENVRGHRQSDGPRGALTISDLAVPLARDFVSGNGNYYDEMNTVYYFVVLVKCGSSVQHTSLMSSESGIQRGGLVEFKQYMQLKNIPQNFDCVVEIYSLRTQKERISHEDKYRLKGNTLKGGSKAKNASMMTMGGGSGGGPSAVLDTGFQCVGKVHVNINTPDSRRFNLIDTQYPLEGNMQMRLKRFPIDKGGISYKGFLSLYQKTQGYGSWTRYWSTLEKGEMKFWKSPEDETTKPNIVFIDLETCTKDGAVVEPHGNFPNSFHLDVWVPKEGSHKEMEKLRVLMAADHKEVLLEWIDVMNKTIKNLLVWSTPVGK